MLHPVPTDVLRLLLAVDNLIELLDSFVASK